jgi:two-component system C4-dicarboxylate transport response regulator DctD
MTTRGRVLIVDDEADMLELLRETLETLDFDPICAGSGEAAVATLNTTRPDALLLDLAMPGLSGLDVLLHCRQRHPDVPVIILAANAEQPMAAQAREAGAFAVVAKPYTIAELSALLDRALAHRA